MRVRVSTSSSILWCDSWALDRHLQNGLLALSNFVDVGRSHISCIRAIVMLKLYLLLLLSALDSVFCGMTRVSSEGFLACGS